MVNTTVLLARPGHTITINARMGQTGSYTGFNAQFWLNTTGNYTLMGQNLSITISSGSSSVMSFVIPINTPEGNYAICTTLSKYVITTLTSSYLSTNYPYNKRNITVDVYPLQVYI